MVVSPTVITAAKYGFLTLVVTSAGLLISNVIVVKHQKVSEFADSLVYDQPNSFPDGNAQSLLSRNFERCLTNPSKSFCQLPGKKRLRLIRSKVFDTEMKNTSGPPITVSPKRKPRPLHKLLLEFGKLMASFKVMPVLLEPSMIYCLLSPSNKLDLIKSGFKLNNYQGSRKVVTFGIFEKDADILNKNSSLTESALSAGFTISRFLIADSVSPGHYFFTRMGLTVHCVVLLEKQGYLLNAGLSHRQVNLEGLLFVKDATFENFTSVRLPIEGSPDLLITIPSDPIQFLYQLPFSKFLECPSEESNESTVIHPYLTPLQLQNRARVGLQELKALLNPHYIYFWLWMDTLQGWIENCNIFGKTVDLNLAVSYTAVRGINLTHVLAGNNYLNILPENRLPDGNTLEDYPETVALDCYGLKINIFICVEERVSVLSNVNSELDKTYRGVIYPEFHLCSTEVYGQRVHVPCEDDSKEIATQETHSKNLD